MKTLQQLIEENKNQRQFPNMVCIGKGDYFNKLINQFPILYRNLWFSHAGDIPDNDSNYSGDNSEYNYYILESFAKVNGLLKKPMSLEQHMDVAREMVKQFKTGKYNLMKVTGITNYCHHKVGVTKDLTTKIVHRTDPTSCTVQTFFDNNSSVNYCVVLTGRSMEDPYDTLTLEEIVVSKELELNSEYTATITKGKVQVGCQTFDIEKVRELIKLHDEIK